MSPFALDVRRFRIVAVVALLVAAGAWWISENATRMQSTIAASRPAPSRAAPKSTEDPAELELQNPRPIGRRPAEVEAVVHARSSLGAIVYAPSSPSGRIGGRVQDHVTRPLSNVRIDLVRPAEVDDRPSCEILEQGAQATPETEWISRRVLRSVESDADGEFHFDSVQPGPYALRAVRRPGLSQLFEGIFLSAGQSQDQHLLRFIADGWLRCRVLGPASFSGWRDLWIAAAVPMKPLQEGTTFPWPSVPFREGATFLWPSVVASVRLTGPGDLIVGPLPPGSATVMLCWEAPPGSHGGRQPPDEVSRSRSVGTVEVVEARESLFEVDASPWLPAYVVLQVRFEGELVSEGHLKLANVDTNESEHLNVSWSEGSPPRLGPLSPGRWILDLGGVEPKAWDVQLPTLLELAPGAEELVSIDVQCFLHTLRIRRPGDQGPLGYRWIDIVPLGLESIEKSGKSFLTTKDGCVEAALPPGSYFVCRQRSGQRRPIEETEGARIEWTPFGPSPAEIELR